MKLLFFLEECELLKNIEKDYNVVYVHSIRQPDLKADTFDIEIYTSIEQIKGSLIPQYGVHGYEAWRITILKHHMESNYEYVSAEQAEKDDKYKSYFKGIVYNPGGIFDNSNLIHGQFYVADKNDTEQIWLFKQIRKQLNKITEKKINGWYIGKTAYKNRGKYRFITIGIQSPVLYDLAVE